MEIYYIPPESRTVQGKESAIYKKYGKEWGIRPLGNGNGNFLLTKRSDIRIDGKSYRDAVLEHYHKSKLTKLLFDTFLSDLQSGNLSLDDL